VPVDNVAIFGATTVGDAVGDAVGDVVGGHAPQVAMQASHCPYWLAGHG
jgi:hypothetical protein